MAAAACAVTRQRRQTNKRTDRQTDRKMDIANTEGLLWIGLNKKDNNNITITCTYSMFCSQVLPRYIFYSSVDVSTF